MGLVKSVIIRTFLLSSAGNNTSGTVGSRTNLTKYRLIIESGAYNNIVLTNGPMYSTRYNIYIAAQGVYGNDYDRATQNNDNLRVYFDTNGSWAVFITVTMTPLLSLIRP